MNRPAQSPTLSAAVGVNAALFALVLAVPALAAPPATLLGALDYLRDHKSYSWEVINSDPGPVAQQFPTRRGSVTLIQQNTSPHVKGSIDRNGDTLIERDWADGVRLDTIITANGAVVTNTPEGWMTNTEILTALAGERVSDKGATPRAIWLRRADRPDIKRPDQELLPMLTSTATFEESGNSFTVQGRLPAASGDSGPPVEIKVTLNLSNGMIRDYEVVVEGSRVVSRARVQVPVSDQRIVILTNIPISRINIPEEARTKLAAAGEEKGR